MTAERDWRRLAEDPAYVGGIVEDLNNRYEIRHRRIARITFDADSISFRFDRVAVRVSGGRWREEPIGEDTAFMWFPWPMMPIAFSPNGVVTMGTEAFPSYIERILPAADIPKDSPLLVPAVQN